MQRMCEDRKILLTIIQLWVNFDHPDSLVTFHPVKSHAHNAHQATPPRTACYMYQNTSPDNNAYSLVLELNKRCSNMNAHTEPTSQWSTCKGSDHVVYKLDQSRVEARCCVGGQYHKGYKFGNLTPISLPSARISQLQTYSSYSCSLVS